MQFVGGKLCQLKIPLSKLELATFFPFTVSLLPLALAPAFRKSSLLGFIPSLQATFSMSDHQLTVIRQEPLPQWNNRRAMKSFVSLQPLLGQLGPHLFAKALGFCLCGPSKVSSDPQEIETGPVQRLTQVNGVEVLNHDLVSCTLQQRQHSGHASGDPLYILQHERSRSQCLNPLQNRVENFGLLFVKQRCAPMEHAERFAGEAADIKIHMWEHIAGAMNIFQKPVSWQSVCLNDFSGRRCAFTAE